MIRTLLLLLVLLPLPAFAAPLVGDLSNYRIDITSSFNGTRIFLFGARNDTGDVVVVVRGPIKDYVVRKKEEVAGIWINREKRKFFRVPDFYAVASNRPLKDIDQSGLFNQLGIGMDNILHLPPDSSAANNNQPFVDALLRWQAGRGLYRNEAEPLTFMGETLFKTTIDFPDDIPPGDYTAEIYLISDGEVTGMQSTPIHVVKSGVDAFVYSYAHNSPVLYGITAVVLALAAGWFAGRLFENYA